MCLLISVWVARGSSEKSIMTLKALQASATSIKTYLFLFNVLNIFWKRSKAFRRENVHEQACLYFGKYDTLEMRPRRLFDPFIFNCFVTKIDTLNQFKTVKKILKATERLKPGLLFFNYFAFLMTHIFAHKTGSTLLSKPMVCFGTRFKCCTWTSLVILVKKQIVET